jgi:hypothetical protein
MGEKWDLTKAIIFALKQHNDGMKLEDLEESLVVMKEDGLIDDCCVANVLDAIDNNEDIDYMIYGSNRYFCFVRG